MTTIDDSALIEALADAVLTARFHNEPVGFVTRRVAREALGPALLPVVRAAQAAELRLQAMRLRAVGHGIAASRLDRRADELDPPAHHGQTRGEMDGDR